MSAFTCFSQNCTYKIKGKVVDEFTGQPLAFAALYIEETQQGVLADEEGNFEISSICVENIHLRVTHISCEAEVKFLNLSTTKNIILNLHHHAELLNELQVHGSTTEQTTQKNVSISKDEIVKNGQLNLAEQLESITGVASLKNGTGISKPVIHGLWGNRISILNNGIAQAGQQWGVDHAPEIDPFSADHLSVIKGVGALAYSGNSLGGIVLVESSPINEDPHLHGSSTYIYNSNGNGNTFNSKLEKASDFLDWRLNFSYKVQGDASTPTYFLTNTGKKESNFSLQLEKELLKKWKSSFYFSSFNTEIGILLGSQISNLTDLKNAFSSETPYFTLDNFSYNINSPRQKVSHQLLKLKLNRILKNNALIEFTYGGQLNNRKEYDVRRGGREDKPALSLTQFSHFLEGNLSKEYSNGISLKSGFQYQLIDNGNVPETGISPLIPDYLSFQFSHFTVVKFQKEKTLYEFGFRLENKQQNVVRITQTYPKEIVRNNRNFTFLSGSFGSTKSFKNIEFTSNFGVSMRPPEVNELYSFGLHQGISSIEIGNEFLKNEISSKGLLSVNYNFKKRFFIDFSTYAQLIKNNIFLQPQQELLLTIRGAFPVFKFEQTNGLLYGTDVLTSLELTEKLKWISKFAYVKGIDLTQDIPLVFIPPLSASFSIKIDLGDILKLKMNEIEVEVQHQNKQNNLLKTQDFVSPPDAFTLFNTSFNSTVQFKKVYLKWGIKATNLLNVSYRNYLNRQRYFADDLGRNIILHTNFSF